MDAIAQAGSSDALVAKLAELDGTLAGIAEQADQLNVDLASLDSGDVDLEEIGAGLADPSRLERARRRSPPPAVREPEGERAGVSGLGCSVQWLK